MKAPVRNADGILLPVRNQYVLASIIRRERIAAKRIRYAMSRMRIRAALR